MKKKELLILCSAFAAQVAFAQSDKVKGTVLDSSGQPVVGATVKVVGTNNATMTDLDGHFTLQNVSSKTQVSVSYLGMQTATVPVSAANKVVLKDDYQNLDGVVVIGYGSAKAKDLTSPITVVKGSDIQAVPSASPMSALQGKVAGVNVVNSGSPGSAPTVRIRGAGSFKNSSPLYVVDGMFYDDITFLNNDDIQDFTILKDASAAAIYGVRAANGVVLITTKKGAKNQKAQITYDGYVGFQNASNVLELCNAKEYATMMLEGDYNSYVTHFKKSIDNYGGSYADSDFHNWTYNTDNDWYDLMLRTALITNHSISINGGTEKAAYSLGGSYLYQDGIMDVDNNYKRLNFRAALDYNATNWLKVGFNGVFSKSEQQVPNNAAWQKAFNCPPIVALYDENNDKGFPDKYGSPDVLGYTSNFYNPIAFAKYFDSKNESYQALTNFYAQVDFIPNKLNLRTNYSYSFLSTQGREFTPAYYVSSWQQSATTQLSKTENKYYNNIWDNTLTYNDQFGRHKVGAMVGMSMRQEQWRYLKGTTSNVPDGEKEYWYIKNGNAAGATVTDDGYCYRGLSYFTRLNYNFDDKYLLVFTMRADGSSKYQEKWGYFPSVGAAWVLSQENFLKNQKWIDMLKVRASWGKLGNDHVAASDGFNSVSSGNKYSGVFGNTTLPGYENSNYFSWLKWEVVEEWNAGFNFITLGNRLNVDVDYFHRMTNNAVISPLLPFSTQTLAGNYGKILNEGFDISLSWNDKLNKDFAYHVGVNMSTLRNRVKELSGHSIIKGGKTVNIVGKEMNSFYGFKMAGVYQTQAEIDADPIGKANGCQPGDLKYADLDGNGVLDGNDRTTLGSYIPNFTYGVNLGFQWKNLDFELTTYGQTGAQMFNRKRALRYASQNYNFDKNQYEERWTGPGSTNSAPSAAALLRTWYVSDQKYSDYFVESADYFRIQNVTVGYTFKNLKFGTYTLPGVRLSVTADRPFTTFKANTFTPELSDSEGWDTEVYPLTSTYTFNVKINF